METKDDSSATKQHRRMQPAAAKQANMILDRG
jgi:hypothetical protein